MKQKIKRIIDLIIVISSAVIILPAIAIISIIIFSRMGCPIFFRQQRPGFKGKPFIMYKFRTMSNKTGQDGQLLPDKDRLTKLGRFLRTTSLDELPEFLNVLRGEMSFVGPRPLAMIYLNRYSKEQARRHDVKPGITGWAQVNGRNDLSWEDRFKLDVWYVDHYNFWIDFKIILLTVKKVLHREGVVPEGRSAMQDFMGNNASSEEENNVKMTS